MTTEAEFYLANPWRGNGMPGFDPAGGFKNSTTELSFVSAQRTIPCEL